MASAKKKQDEKNLKLLRELVSQSGNKECFDCRQRGPTYVNMTIGSFVCTSCSGILRGLTPPHRVKSISMATFTQDEIEHIKERGNDFCRRIWLGLADRTAQISDTKDEQKMKDLMIAKYELKRYYLDPSVIHSNPPENQGQNKNKNQKLQTSATCQTGIPRVPYSGTIPAVSHRLKNPEVSDTDSFNADFAADFNKVPDPFSAATPTQQFNQAAFIPQPSFANFDNNPIFSASKRNESVFNSNQLNESFTNFNAVNITPSEDRYAALKDLDSLMKQAQLKEDPASVTDTNHFAGNQSPWSVNNQTTSPISNPFTIGGTWQSSSNLINNNSHITDNMCNSANPFRSTQYTSSNDQCYGIDSAANGDINLSSQLAARFTNKVWQPSYHPNPFTVGPGVVGTSRNSNNPFL